MGVGSRRLADQDSLQTATVRRNEKSMEMAASSHTGGNSANTVPVRDKFHTTEEPLWRRMFSHDMFKSKTNVLLVFVLFSILADELSWGHEAVFIFSFLSIIPLAMILGVATEEIGLIVKNENVAGLLNATFGNAVELIIAIVALERGLISVVQASLLGSILSNVLLVLGMSFFFGGLKFSSQRFNQTAAGTSCSMLTVTVLALVVPAILSSTSPNKDSDLNAERVENVSRYTSLLLLAIYLLYLVFQLRTHKHLFEGEESEEQEEPQLSMLGALVILAGCTALVTIESELLVEAINPVAKSANIPTTFIGVIILPIVGNAAEHMTAVTVAMKDKMDLAMSVCIGSSADCGISIQIAMFVAPLLVVLGWMIGQPMTLDFHVFQTAVVFGSVMIVNSVAADGESNWLEGAMLLVVYGIISIAMYFHQDEVDNL